MGVVHLVLLDVSVLNVANRVGDAAYKLGYAFVAFAACANGPVHSSAFAYFALPLGADFAQVVGEDEAGARAVGAAYGGDGCIRQGNASVHGGNGGVVPFGDFAQIDVSQQRAREFELARVNAFDVNHWNYAANNGGELHQASGFELFVFQGHVGCAEIYGFCLDLLQASARAYGLVIDLRASCCLVISSPFGVQRCRERCACASDVLCLCSGCKAEG